MRTLTRSRWYAPLFCLVLGGLLFGAFAIGGKPGEGLAGLAVMVVAGLVFLLGSTRSETVAGLGGPGRDERWAMIDLRATALSGLALIAATAGAWLYNLAQGEERRHAPRPPWRAGGAPPGAPRA
jgi:multisubunit Na+/H+ antiporter MnhB subunit